MLFSCAVFNQTKNANALIIRPCSITLLFIFQLVCRPSVPSWRLRNNLPLTKAVRRCYCYKFQHIHILAPVRTKTDF